MRGKSNIQLNFASSYLKDNVIGVFADVSCCQSLQDITLPFFRVTSILSTDMKLILTSKLSLIYQIYDCIINVHRLKKSNNLHFSKLHIPNFEPLDKFPKIFKKKVKSFSKINTEFPQKRKKRHGNQIQSFSSLIQFEISSFSFSTLKQIFEKCIEFHFL